MKSVYKFVFNKKIQYSFVWIFLCNMNAFLNALFFCLSEEMHLHNSLHFEYARQIRKKLLVKSLI